MAHGELERHVSYSAEWLSRGYREIIDPDKLRRGLLRTLDPEDEPDVTAILGESSQAGLFREPGFGSSELVCHVLDLSGQGARRNHQCYERRECSHCDAPPQTPQLENSPPCSACRSGYPSYVIRKSVQRTRYPRTIRRRNASAYRLWQ